MSDLRKAAQQALDYIEEIMRCPGRTAGSNQRLATLAHNALREALAETAEQPVAWMYFDSDGDAIFGHPNGYRPDDAVPVYTTPHPAKREPLTPPTPLNLTEHEASIYDRGWIECELAHGITKE